MKRNRKRVKAEPMTQAKPGPEESPFDKDIELAKLQAKISGAQTWYYTLTGGFLAVLFGSLIVLFTVALPPIWADAINAIQVGTVIGIILAQWSASKDRKRFRQNFDDIYNHKRIEY